MFTGEEWRIRRGEGVAEEPILGIIASGEVGSDTGEHRQRWWPKSSPLLPHSSFGFPKFQFREVVIENVVMIALKRSSSRFYLKIKSLDNVGKEGVVGARSEPSLSLVRSSVVVDATADLIGGGDGRIEPPAQQAPGERSSFSIFLL